jgi:hypothetical protein
MIRKFKYILLILLTAIVYDSAAQNSQVLYYMNLPQRHFLNPALRPSNSLYIGLPALSGINVNVNNNFFNFSDIFMNSGDSVISILHPDYDVSKFVAKIKNINAIEPEATVQLFGLGFNAGKDLYIFLDINERVSSNVAIPGDLLRLAFEGNEQFVGNKIDLSSLRGSAMWYHEAGLGFSKNFGNNLRIGVKGKLLMGMASASIDNRSLGITINNDYTHTFDADLMVNLSAPLTVYVNGQNNLDSISFDDSRFNKTSGIIDYLLDFNNLGLGLDIGAEYSFSDRLKVSASVTDLGYIKWKRDISNLKAESQFDFSGIDLLEVYNGNMTFDSLAKELLDSLKNSLYLTETATSFTTNLPFGICVGGSYNLTKNLSVGLLSYTRIVGKQIKEALTVSANVNLGNAFSTTLAYTAANGRYDNLGAGISFRAGCFQIYMLADRIPVTWNKIVTNNSNIPVPVSWNTIHARIGMNLAFGNKIKKKNDKPMVIVE